MFLFWLTCFTFDSMLVPIFDTHIIMCFYGVYLFIFLNRLSSANKLTDILNHFDSIVAPFPFRAIDVLFLMMCTVLNVSAIMLGCLSCSCCHLREFPTRTTELRCTALYRFLRSTSDKLLKGLGLHCIGLCLRNFNITCISHAQVRYQAEFFVCFCFCFLSATGMFSLLPEMWSRLLNVRSALRMAFVGQSMLDVRQELVC